MTKDTVLHRTVSVFGVCELTVTLGFTARNSKAFSSNVRNLRETLKVYLL